MEWGRWMERGGAGRCAGVRLGGVRGVLEEAGGCSGVCGAGGWGGGDLGGVRGVGGAAQAGCSAGG